jgi:hypothetical protein
MDLQLSWDLFIVVFFVVISAYSLIIGRNNTVKVIIGSYIALVAADAIGEIISHYFLGTQMFVLLTKEAQLGGAEESIIFTKVLVFLFLVILFAVRGAFVVDTYRGNGALSLIFHLIYSILSAGLIISTILILISGVSVIGGGSLVSEALTSLTDKSYLVRNMVYYHKLWFAGPAIVFLLHSFIGERLED